MTLPRRNIKKTKSKAAATVKRGRKKVDLPVAIAESTIKFDHEPESYVHHVDGHAVRPFDKLRAHDDFVGKKEIAERLVERYLAKKEISAEKSAQHRKLLLMWIGIALIMTVILFFWTLNLRRVINEGHRQDSQASLSIDQAKQEVDKTMENIKQGLSDLKTIGANTSTPEVATTTQEIFLPSTDTATTTIQ